ncbi:MAG: CPBP family intramembrane glutamic endopeptidase [Saprospiraceae bacterium]
MKLSGKDALVNLLLLLLVMSLGLMLYGLVTTIGLYFHNGGGAGSSIPSLTDYLDTMNARQLLVLQLLSHLCILILPAVVLSMYRPGITNYYRSYPPYLTFGIYALAFFICSLPMTGFLSYVNSLFALPEWLTVRENEINALLKRILSTHDWSDYIYVIVTVGLIPGIAEEWIFRGIIQNQLVRLLGSPWAAILLSSIIFSSMHLQFEGFLPRMGLGFILGTIYYLGGNILYSAMLHFLFNGIQVIYVSQIGVDSLDNKDFEAMKIIPAAIVSLILCYFMFRKLNQFKLRQPWQQEL